MDWNSKKAGQFIESLVFHLEDIFFSDDDDIETNISVQYHLGEEASGRLEPSMPSPEPLDLTADGVHGFNENGASACCRRTSDQGLVDCSACVGEAWNVLCASLDANSRDAAERVLRLTMQAKEHGVKKTEIIVCRHQFKFFLF